MNRADLHEFQALLDRVCDGLHDADDMRRLNTLLAADPDARAYYRRAMDLHGRLQWEELDARRVARSREEAVSGQRSAVRQSSRHTPCAVTQESVISGPWSVEEDLPSTSSRLTTDNGQRTSTSIPHSLLNRPGLFSAVSAAAFIIAGLFLLGLIRIPRAVEEGVADKGHPKGIAPVFVAQFTNAHQCVWENEWDAPFVGAHLQLGQVIELREGIAEVTFRNSAVALVEGPARFVVEGKGLGRLDLGRLAARVDKKEAAGFTIKTPTASVIDLGTEFGVEVGDDGGTEVQVFQGVVEARRTGSRQYGGRVGAIKLRAGEAVEIDRLKDDVLAKKGDNARFLALREAFASPESASAASAASAVRRMEEYHRLMAEDRRLVAYYPFFRASESEAKVVKNKAPTADGHSLEVGLHDVGWGNGRWSGSRALKFSGPLSGQYAEIRDSEEKLNASEPMSVAIWFQVRKFNISYQTLVAKGVTGWRLHRFGESNILAFDTSYIRSINEESIGLTNAVHTSTELTDTNWHQVVCVYQPDRNPQIVHLYLYLDGRLERAMPGVRSVLSSEPIWIGNSSEKRERIFYGCIDELSIFSTALSEEEVSRLYVAGSPIIPLLNPKDISSSPRTESSSP